MDGRVEGMFYFHLSTRLSFISTTSFYGYRNSPCCWSAGRDIRGCYRGALGVEGVPGDQVAAGLLGLVYQTDYFLTEQVVYRQLDVGTLRHLVADRRGRVERVGGGRVQRKRVGAEVPLPETG